jgi:hypothetical protein
MALDTSLNPLNSSAGYGASGSGAAPTPVSGPDMVAQVDNLAAVQQAVQLAATASVVVSLGNSIGSDGLTYNAVGVFDAIVDAGTATNTAPDITQNQATQSLDQGILGSVASPPAAAGIYNGAGEFTGLDSGFTPQLASLLKSDPQLADSIVGDVATQGIVGALFSTTA